MRAFVKQDSLFLLLLVVSRVLVLDRSEFKELCARCIHADTLLPVRVLPELKLLPVLLFASLDMYALIKA